MTGKYSWGYYTLFQSVYVKSIWVIFQRQILAVLTHLLRKVIKYITVY